MRAFFPNPDFLDDLGKELADVFIDAAEKSAVKANEFGHRIMPDVKNRGSLPSVDVQIVSGRIYLANHDHGAMIDEFGSVNSPPYAPLRRGVEAAGFRFEEKPR